MDQQRQNLETSAESYFEVNAAGWNQLPCSWQVMAAGNSNTRRNYSVTQTACHQPKLLPAQHGRCRWKVYL